MSLLRDLVIFSAKSFIAIGDGVIWLFLAVFKLFLKVWQIIQGAVRTTQGKFQNSLRSLKSSFDGVLGLAKRRESKTIFKNNVLAKRPNFKIRKRIYRKIFEAKRAFKSLIFRQELRVTLAKRNLSKFELPKLRIKRRRKVRKTKFFPLPIFTKVKYFILGFLVSSLFVFLPTIFVLTLETLPHPNQLVTQEVAQTTKIYDRSGKLLYQIYADRNRTIVPLSEIPKDLKNATIAIEDKNFYKTPGFDLFAIARSILANLRGQPLQGGSTITQQLIKTRLLTPERTINRKVKEIVLSVWAEKIYSKDQILEMYLNQVPYGGTAWGVEAASQAYFDKSVKDLTLSESTFLAGLPRAPSIYSPYGQSPSLWKSRQKDVLEKMVELGFITKTQAEETSSKELSFRKQANIIHAPHFVMYIKDLLTSRYGIEMVEKGGLTVMTSLDLKTQEMAEKIVAEQVDANSYLNLTNGAALITNPKNGDIIAMVGGRDYDSENGGNFNVTTARRQPGSTIKVVTYSGALMNGFTAATVIADSPVSYASGNQTYRPVNYSGGFRGNVTLRQALANSINVPAVKTLNKIGVEKMVSLAKKMGIDTWSDPKNYGLSITLGSAEVRMTDMAEVYGTLANGGERVDLNPILKITNYRGEVLEEKNDRRDRVIPESVAFIISNILSDNRSRSLEFGTNSPLSIPGHTVSVKTGTTDNKRDNWTIGFTKSLLVAVWVGNNDNSPMDPSLTSGITGAAPIWNRIITELLKDAKNEPFSPPSEIVQKPCFGRIEYFVKGTENSASCRPLSLTPTSPTPAP